MLSNTTLKRLCKPVVLRRARRMVDLGGFISKRRYRLDEGETVLRARVDSQASWEEAHRTMVVLDEEADAVAYYECDCRPTHAADSPCDHVAALIMDYNKNPEAYEGYEARDKIATSRSIRRLMDLGTLPPQPSPTTQPTELEGATVRLEATLAYEVGFSVRFRLAGSKGAYALKSIGEFVGRVEAAEFAEYGGRLAFEHVPRSFSAQARPVVDFLVRAVQNRRSYALERVVGRHAMGASTSMPGRELRLSAPELWELLELYARDGLLFEDRSTLPIGGESPHEVHIVDGDPNVDLHIVSLEDGDAFELVRPTGMRMVSAGTHALAWDAQTLYRCSQTVSENVGLLSILLGNPTERLVVTDKDVPVFCASVLRQLDACARVSTPPRFDKMRPKPCELRFYVDYDARRSLVTCDPHAVYGDVDLPLLGPQQQASTAVPPAIVRDMTHEARGREVLRRYFQIREGRAFSKATGQDLGTIVYEGVADLQEVGTVFAYPAFERLRNRTRPKVRVGLSVRSRLLELNMRLEGLPQEELSGLLESYRRKQKYHQLEDGSVVRVEDVELSTAGKLADELELDADQVAKPIVVPAYRSLVAESLFEADNEDDSLESYLREIRGTGFVRRSVPPSLDTVLRPYQQEGFQWLCGLSDLGLGGILADEMGLGKSIQLIAFLLAHKDEAQKVGPSLVVCPSSLVYNWQAECEKFAPELKCRVVLGTPQERTMIRGLQDTDVLITSYDLIRRDLDDYEGRRLWCVVLDEAQYIKNPITHTAQAVKRLKAVNRVALTGTPVENRLSELWSIFDFLMPGLLGSYERFRERFERPIVEDEDSSVAIRLREALRPFILRRTKRDVVTDLPDKIEQVVRTHMGSEQRRLYDAQVQEARSQASANAFDNNRFQILALLTRLRQMCCDPQLLYDDYADGSCKTETILTLVERVVDADEKMLLFSQFTSYLNIIEQELDRRGIAHYVLTGSTPSTRRIELVRQFNEDDTPVFLISLKAGGTGLNLTGATVVVHADPWWNVAAQNQATDRAHRIGQTRAVTVYKVIASETIEERILELQQTKAELADAVVQGDATSVSLASLTREDLEELLG